MDKSLRSCCSSCLCRWMMCSQDDMSGYTDTMSLSVRRIAMLIAGLMDGRA